MSDHKRLLAGPGPDAAPTTERAPIPDPGLPLAPVPVPMVARSPADAVEPTTIHRLFGRRGAKVAPEPPDPRVGRGEELDSPDNYKHVPSKAKKVLGIDDGQFMETPVGKFSDASTASKRGVVAAIKAEEKTKNVHQPVSDLGEVYAHCAMLEAEFKHQVQAIASQSRGTATFRPGGKMKSMGRTLEKMMADYGGDASRVVDLTGGSISFENADDLVRGYGVVWSNPMFNVVRVKNSLAKGKGYGDINMSIEMGSADFEIVVDGKTVKEHYPGFVIELQLHLAPIIGAKEAAHKPYEKQRSIDAKNSGKDKATWSPEDRTEWQSLENQMVAMYGTAWQSLGGDAAVKAKVDLIAPMDPT